MRLFFVVVPLISAVIGQRRSQDRPGYGGREGQTSLQRYQGHCRAPSALPADCVWESAADLRPLNTGSCRFICVAARVEVTIHILLRPTDNLNSLSLTIMDVI